MKFLAVPGLLALAACAQAPDAIAPVAMPAVMYDHLSCRVAAAERRTVVMRVAALEEQQRTAAAGDAGGVVFVCAATVSLPGEDRAGLLATENGKALPLDARLARC